MDAEIERMLRDYATFRPDMWERIKYLIENERVESAADRQRNQNYDKWSREVSRRIESIVEWRKVRSKL